MNILAGIVDISKYCFLKPYVTTIIIALPPFYNNISEVTWYSDVTVLYLVACSSLNVMVGYLCVQSLPVWA